MTQEAHYDIIVIGAGPIGLTLGIEAKKAGLTHLIIEKGVLVNSIFNFPTNMTFFSTSKLLEIGEVPFISHSDKPTRREALEYYRRVYDAWDLNIHFYEEVTDYSGEKGNFQISTSKGKYSCNNIVLATGFYDSPRLLDVPGEELPKVRHYYQEPHIYVGQKLVVIGAANSACDVALETYHKGADVTMVVREPTIYERVKYWIKPNIENRIKEGSIKAFFNSKVIKIEEDHVIIKTPDGEIKYPNDFVLAMTGYKPNYQLMDLLGLQYEQDEWKTPVHNEETLESSIKGIYLAGVVKAGLRTSLLFIENTRHHAKAIVKHMKG
ncbi:MAG: YpdA family putative bacillithiol disulfide reductase [Saprospiraceae bacterium]|nr:YpdA family putative bacillithiol disulfide reductase [Saprospiraceae bacterium]